MLFLEHFAWQLQEAFIATYATCIPFKLTFTTFHLSLFSFVSALLYLYYISICSTSPFYSFPSSLHALPFSLACMFGIRTALIVLYTWAELIRSVISLNLNIILGTITWTLGVISLPSRFVNAFRRERQLEEKLQQMQNKVEGLIWDQKKFQERFQMAIKECKMMEMLLAELEEEHDMAIAEIEKLEKRLRDQINENLRLKEIQGKAYWSSKDQNDTDNSQNIDDKTRTELLKLLKTGPKSSSVPPTKPKLIEKDVAEMSEVLDHRREIALSQSLFSAIMSLIVGITIWEAEDPCMPLVVALFAVVGMSLKSVVQFFFSIKNKPASDAVALLSFNCFILGTLTYPSFPRIARSLAPVLLHHIDRAMSRFGFFPLA